MQAVAQRKLHSLPVKLSAGAVLVALADLFFYGHPLGWAAGLYAMALLGALSALHGGFLQSRQSQFIALLLCILSFALVTAPGMLALLLYAAGIVSLLVLHKRGRMQDTVVWIKDALKFLFKGLNQSVTDRSRMLELRRRRKIPTARWNAAAGLIVVPAALAVIFAFLFAQANPVIGAVVDAIDWDFLRDLLSPWRWLFWIATGAAVWAVLRPRFRPALPSTATLPNLDGWFNPSSVAMSLIVFNALFGIENALDIAFLWSGKPLPNGVTYAQYAHAGAYPLIVTALLAGAYILITFSDRKYQTTTTRTLVYAWIAQNIFLVASSIDRLTHYIEIYSLTYLRLAALIWMALVALGLALTVFKIQFSRSNMWLINRNMLASLGVLYGCCFVNFDRIIADYNVRHASEVLGSGEVLDMAYMQSLGPEAVPALRWFRENAKFSPSRAAEAGVLADTLERNLTDAMQNDWHAWTWRNQARLQEILSQQPVSQPIDHTGWRTKE